MPSSRAACDSDPLASIASSRAIFPGPTEPVGAKSMRRRTSMELRFAIAPQDTPARPAPELKSGAADEYRYVQVNIARLLLLVAASSSSVGPWISAPARAQGAAQPELLVF